MNLCLQAEIETDGGRMYGPQGGGEWDEVRGWDCRVYTATSKTDSPWEPVHHRGIIIGINLSIESAQCSWRPKRDGNPKKRGHVSHRAESLCCAVETNAALSSKYTPIKKKKYSLTKRPHRNGSHIFTGHPALLRRAARARCTTPAFLCRFFAP